MSRLALPSEKLQPVEAADKSQTNKIITRWAKGYENALGWRKWRSFQGEWQGWPPTAWHSACPHTRVTRWPVCLRGSHYNCCLGGVGNSTPLPSPRSPIWVTDCIITVPDPPPH